MKTEKLAIGLGALSLVSMGVAVLSNKYKVQDTAFKVTVLSILGLGALTLFEIDDVRNLEINKL